MAHNSQWLQLIVCNILYIFIHIKHLSYLVQIVNFFILVFTVCTLQLLISNLAPTIHKMFKLYANEL